jgi:hypothetical protein
MPERVFNPNASVEVVNFDDRHFCLTIDDALLEPERLVQQALAQQRAFEAVDFSFYPGVYLMAPPELTASLTEFFQWQVRRRFDARRCLEVVCRYSLVTLPPDALQPIQWLCHRDYAELDPKLAMLASVLYLFHDPNLGGTSFYVPTRSAAETSALFRAALALTPEAFTQQYGIRPGYIQEGNDYFRRIGRVPAKWNRLIFYDGGLLHSSDIPAPERLSNDPLTGRLTLNGFFTCRRNLT